MQTPKLKTLDGPATGACLGALLCWSLGPIFIRFLAGHIDVWTQNMLRYSVACLFWLPFLVHSIRRGSVERKLWLIAIAPAAVNIVMQSFWAASFYYLEPAYMILLAKSSVVWIAAFSLTFFPDERGLIRSRNFWLAVILSGVGVGGVLLFKADFGTKEALTGTVIGLTASFLWAVYTITVKIAFRKHDSRKGFGILSIYTVVGLWILAFVVGKPEECFDMAPWPWASVVISGVLSIALSHVLYYLAIKRIGATIPSLVLLVQPFIIYGISSIVFKEALSPRQWVFGLILLCGAVLGILAQRDVRMAKLKLEQDTAVSSQS